MKNIKKYLIAFLVFICMATTGNFVNSADTLPAKISWGEPTRIYKPRVLNAYYPRPLLLSNGSIIVAFDTDEDSYGITKVKVIVSGDNGHSWSDSVVVAQEDNVTCATPSLIQMPDGEIRCFYRTSKKVNGNTETEIKWRRSTDNGRTWLTPNSGEVIDKAIAVNRFGGIWEPHPNFVNGDLYVMYCDDSDRVDITGTSQNIVYKKWENDNWSDAFDISSPGDSRDGMPVWIKHKSGKYITVFECTDTQPTLFGLKYKISPDGYNWSEMQRLTIDIPLPGRVNNAPFVTMLEDGRLLCTFQSDNDNEVRYGVNASSCYAIEGMLNGDEIAWGQKYRLQVVPDNNWATMVSSLDIGDKKVLAFWTSDYPSPGLYMSLGSYNAGSTSSSKSESVTIKSSSTSEESSSNSKAIETSFESEIDSKSSLLSKTESTSPISKRGNVMTQAIIFVSLIIVFAGLVFYLIIVLYKNSK